MYIRIYMCMRGRGGYEGLRGGYEGRTGTGGTAAPWNCHRFETVEPLGTLKAFDLGSPCAD